MDIQFSAAKPHRMSMIRKTVLFVFCATIAIVLFESTTSSSFKLGTVVKIPQGTTLSQAATTLKNAGVIRSERLFKAYALILEGDTRSLRTGEYLFADSLWTPIVAYRLVKGVQGFPVAKITIPEGSATKDIARIITKSIPSFDSRVFIDSARPYEGYLFPETYFWPSNVTPERVIRDMKSEFDNKMTQASSTLTKFGRPLSDVVKMAAILEREAATAADRKLVAGVLWKRLDAGAALRVDAPFEYFLDKPSSKLTLEDLARESPYNLYIHTGIGPTPIANPGLEAILDAATPTSSEFWYYLSDEHGILHYAVTLDGHATNKDKYIK